MLPSMPRMTCLALLAVAAAPASGDRFTGTWRLDKAKSTIADDHGLGSKEIVFAPAPGGGLITESVEMAATPGKKDVTRLSFVYGRVVAQHRPGLDAFLVTRAGPRRVFWVARFKGKQVARLQVDLSPDGRAMTFRYLSSAADPTGKVTHDRYVYDRQ